MLKLGCAGGMLLSILYILDFLLGVEVLHNVYNTGFLGADFILEPLLFTISIFICAAVGVLSIKRLNKNGLTKWGRIMLLVFTGMIVGIIAAITWFVITLIEPTIYGTIWIYSTMLMSWPLLYSLVTMALGQGVLSNICHAFILGVMYTAITVISGKVLKVYASDPIKD